jgi:hypothetical protein
MNRGEEEFVWDFDGKATKKETTRKIKIYMQICANGWTIVKLIFRK